MPASKLPAIKRERNVKQFKRIEMRIIPPGCMRPQYANSWGDYFLDERDTLQIRAVEMPVYLFSIFILIHEFWEAIRCYKDGISLESIERWDADHADHKDPGHIKGCPYRRYHQDSETLERIAAMQTGIDWDEYYNSEPVRSDY